MPDSTCKTFTDLDGNTLPAFAQRFYAEGEERTTIDIPPGYGYPNRAADRWGMTYMLMNHRNVADTVYVRYTVRYVIAVLLIMFAFLPVVLVVSASFNPTGSLTSIEILPRHQGHQFLVG